MTYKDRLLEEHTALADKIAKLTAFLALPGFKDLPEVDRTLLRAQLAHMLAYAYVLEERLGRELIDFIRVPEYTPFLQELLQY